MDLGWGRPGDGELLANRCERVSCGCSLFIFSSGLGNSGRDHRSDVIAAILLIATIISKMLGGYESFVSHGRG